MCTDTAGVKHHSFVHCSQAVQLELRRNIFFSKMWFPAFILDVLMTFLSTVSVLASSIDWLMSQLANVMFFLLQLLIIGMTFCPSEPLQKLCTAEERNHTNPACIQSKYGQKNMFRNILYRPHTVHDVQYMLHMLLLWNSLQRHRKTIFKKKYRPCFNKTGCSSGRQYFPQANKGTLYQKESEFGAISIRFFFLYQLICICTITQRGEK